MIRQGRPSRRTLMAERELRCYPPDARALFQGDPAVWLPGTVTRHGASTFRSRMRVQGVSVEVQFRVGMPWTRGTSTTRHLRMQCVDPGMAWLLPAVEGDLNLLGEQRLRLRFEGAAVGVRTLSVRRSSVPWVMRRVTAGIVARLTAGTPSLVRPMAGIRR
jgi:hypothetical protein